MDAYYVLLRKPTTAGDEQACEWNKQGRRSMSNGRNYTALVSARVLLKAMTVEPQILMFCNIEKDSILLRDPTGNSREAKLPLEPYSIGNAMVSGHHGATEKLTKEGHSIVAKGTAATQEQRTTVDND